jgi:hypothetical protein
MMREEFSRNRPAERGHWTTFVEYMIAGDDLRLERQGDALIVHSRRVASWVGALSIFGFALIWLKQIYWIMMPNQSGRALLGYWLSVVIGVMIVGIGVFLLLPREVITTFDLRSHRVHHHLSIGRGCYDRRSTYAFAEIAGLGLKYYAEPGSYMPVMALRNGETRRLSTANGSHLIYAMTIEAMCAATGLQNIGVRWGS